MGTAPGSILSGRCVGGVGGGGGCSSVDVDASDRGSAISLSARQCFLQLLQ